MTHTVMLKQIGRSVGAILTKDLLRRQHLSANDEVFVTETEDGILVRRLLRLWTC